MWFYYLNNQQGGPIAEEAMIDLILKGSVHPETLVWREGMADWAHAGKTELQVHFVSATGHAPGVPLSIAPQARPWSYAAYTPESFKTLWIWYACLAGTGVMCCVTALPAVVIGFILLFRFWSIIEDGNVRTTPGMAVGFCFIPLFNLYWLYVAYVGLARDMNKYCDERGIAGPRVSGGLALAFYILQIVLPFFTVPIAIAGMFVPFIGLLNFVFLIPLIVVKIILLKQYSDIAAAIAGKKATG